MRSRLSVAAFGLVVLATTLGWFYRDDIRTYLSNDVGAPGEDRTVDAVSPAARPTLRLAAAGDVGTGGPAEYRTAAAMDALDEEIPFDALLLLGDNVYEDGDPSQVKSKVLDPFAAVLDGGTELLSVLGNHDVRDGNGPAQAEALGMPGRWYSTVTHEATIIALDSNQPENREQLEWLRSTLADSATTWTIVMMHHPPYSAGWHGSEPSVQANFVPLFEEFDVDLVLSGHDHDYQRSKEINGVTYVVTGAAAKLRRTGRAEFTEVSWSTHSFLDLAVYRERILGQAIDHDGRVIDSFELQPR